MMRLIAVAIIIWLIWRMWKKAFSIGGEKHQENRNDNCNDSTIGASGEMIACNKCGTFLLKSESIEKKGRFYCCEKCMIEDKK